MSEEGLLVSGQTSQDLEWTAVDARAVDLIRVLAMDAVQKAGSGHPGTAMSLAPAAYLLFQRILKHDPNDPHWPGRDRFVLSCGHSSLTLYIQLYLSGYGLTIEDLEALRTWGSRTPRWRLRAMLPCVSGSKVPPRAERRMPRAPRRPGWPATTTLACRCRVAC